MALSFQSRSATSSLFFMYQPQDSHVYVIVPFASLSFVLLDFTPFRSYIMYNISFMISLIMNLMDVFLNSSRIHYCLCKMQFSDRIQY